MEKIGLVLEGGGVQSAYLATVGSETTFIIINGVLYISDMWIR